MWHYEWHGLLKQTKSTSRVGVRYRFFRLIQIQSFLYEGLETGSPYISFGISNNLLLFEICLYSAAILRRRKCQSPSLVTREKQLKTSHVDITCFLYWCSVLNIENLWKANLWTWKCSATDYVFVQNSFWKLKSSCCKLAISIEISAIYSSPIYHFPVISTVTPWPFKVCRISSFRP